MALNRRLLLGTGAAALASNGKLVNALSLASLKPDGVLGQMSLFSVAGTQAQDALTHLNRLNKDRATAVIIGDDESLERLQESISFTKETPAELIRASNSLDFSKAMGVFRDQAWARSRADYMEDLQKSGKPLLEDDIEDFPLNRPKPDLGEWVRGLEIQPKGTPFTVARDIVENTFYDKVYIALAPTPDPTEVLAWFKYGSWNECPPPEYHLAAMRYWRDLFGATITDVGFDTIVVSIRRPITTREKALEQAKLMYDYCSDIIDQGTTTISGLAQEIMNSNQFFFWWD
jgi:hypothetical protein